MEKGVKLMLIVSLIKSRRLMLCQGEECRGDDEALDLKILRSSESEPAEAMSCRSSRIFVCRSYLILFFFHSLVTMTPKAEKMRNEPIPYRYENLASLTRESKMALKGNVIVRPSVVTKGPSRSTERAQQ